MSWLAVRSVCVGLLIAASMLTSARADEKGWVPLFDGTTLDGWTENEQRDSCKVVDGRIVLNGQRSHLFYTGPVDNHDFVDFDLKMEVMTESGSNSGVFFHTRYQEAGSLNYGYEAQLNATHTDPRRTGSIFKVQDLEESPVADNQWFEYQITVAGKLITVRVDGKVVNQYREPDNVEPPQDRPGRKLSHGTIALQAHDPGSTVYIRNIRIKTPTTAAAVASELTRSSPSRTCRPKTQECRAKRKLFQRRSRSR